MQTQLNYDDEAYCLKIVTAWSNEIPYMLYMIFKTMRKSSPLLGIDKHDIPFVSQHPSIPNKGCILECPYRFQPLALCHVYRQLVFELFHQSWQRSLGQDVFPIAMSYELNAHLGAVCVKLAIKGAGILLDVDGYQSWKTG